MTQPPLTPERRSQLETMRTQPTVHEEWRQALADAMAEVDRLSGELADFKAKQTLVESYLHDPEHRTMFANERMIYDAEIAREERDAALLEVQRLKTELEKRA